MIVKAKSEYAQQVCDVIKQSIQVLCVSDHKNDSDIIDSWLSNKTVSNCRSWIESKQNKSFVMIEEGVVSGISMIGSNGYIYLCYVHPDKVGFGIGKSLLSACETQAFEWSLSEITVDSTLTAKSFYESQGFHKNGEPFLEQNLWSYPLVKKLE